MKILGKNSGKDFALFRELPGKFSPRNRELYRPHVVGGRSRGHELLYGFIASLETNQPIPPELRSVVVPALWALLTSTDRDVGIKAFIKQLGLTTRRGPKDKRWDLRKKECQYALRVASYIAKGQPYGKATALVAARASKRAKKGRGAKGIDVRAVKRAWKEHRSKAQDIVAWRQKLRKIRLLHSSTPKEKAPATLVTLGIEALHKELF